MPNSSSVFDDDRDRDRDDDLFRVERTTIHFSDDDTSDMDQLASEIAATSGKVLAAQLAATRTKSDKSAKWDSADDGGAEILDTPAKMAEWKRRNPQHVPIYVRGTLIGIGTVLRGQQLTHAERWEYLRPDGSHMNLYFPWGGPPPEAATLDELFDCGGMVRGRDGSWRQVDDWVLAPNLLHTCPECRAPMPHDETTPLRAELCPTCKRMATIKYRIKGGVKAGGRTMAQSRTPLDMQPSKTPPSKPSPDGAAVLRVQ